MSDLRDVVVRKPWGHEYQCYQNEHLAIWALHMHKGHATSLHCHPMKNTAFIFLGGELDLEFLRGPSLRFRGLHKINVFRGRFHRLRALTDCVLLEVEAPDDKRDIVRLEDDYGRSALPLEQATEKPGGEDLVIEEPGSGVYAGCRWSLSAAGASEFESDVVVTIRGGLNRGLVPPGDAIDGASLRRLATAFGIAGGTSFLRISQVTP